MALNQAKASIQTGGYECDWVETPPDDVKCQICLTVCRDPLQHEGCGKIFCTSCIRAHQQNSPNCPNCREQLAKSLFQDKRSIRSINALKVKCSNLTRGCTRWVGELSYLQEHLNTCEYVLVPCENECKKDDKIVKVMRKDIEDHLANHCPKKYDKIVKVMQKDVQEHLAKLNQYDPKRRIQRKIEPAFFSQYTAVILVACVLISFLTTSSTNTFLAKESADYVKTTTALTNRKLEELVRATQERCTVTFKLDNFQQHKKASDNFYSDPFYTSPRGYKLILNILVNGYSDGAGKGTHVSVGAYLMKGNHDDTLTWPFLGTVTVELLNQLEDENHHKEKITFIDNDCSKRVVEGDRGVGWGELEYIPHTSLEHDPTKNCQYLKDNSLIFRVIVSDPNYKPWLE